MSAMRVMRDLRLELHNKDGSRLTFWRDLDGNVIIRSVSSAGQFAWFIIDQGDRETFAKRLEDVL